MLVSTYNLRQMSNLREKSNLTKRSSLTKRSELTEISNLRRKSNVRKISNIKNVNFQICPPLPLLPPILWVCCLIFAGPKRNSGKPKVRRFDFGIATVEIWTLS